MSSQDALDSAKRSMHRGLGTLLDISNCVTASTTGYRQTVDADYSFASYHAKTVVNGKVVDYKRTFELKELSIPVNRAEDLRKFYRTIAGDERNTVVLMPLP